MTMDQTAAAHLPTPSETTPQPSHEPSSATAPVAPAVTDATPAAPEITNGRSRIDALDEQIAELILRRGDVSREIQAARIADGGRRVDLRRETEIIARYTAALGRPGTAIAMALLELGRGRA